MCLQLYGLYKGQGPVGLCVYNYAFVYLCVWCSHSCNPRSPFEPGYQRTSPFSHLLLFHLSLSSLSLHLPLTQIQITFTHMTEVLKQWKTNISHADKTILKSIIPSLLLPFCLCGCLSQSVSVSSCVFLFQCLHCQSLDLSHFPTLKSSNGNADMSRSMLFIVESRWIFHVSKDRLELRHTHRLSWTHGIASLQSALCLSAVVKGMRRHLHGCEVFSGSRGEQPLMILSWFCPRRTFWQMLGRFDWHICLMSFWCLLHT